MTQKSGSNEPKVTDDDVIAVNLSKIQIAQRDAEDGRDNLRDVLDSVEGKGIDIKAAKKALKLIQAGDVEAWVQETATITKYLRILRHGVDMSQLDLFETESAEAPIDEKAGLDGRAAGLMGRAESSNPHEISTDAGQAWLAGFRDGANQREMVMAMTDPKETLIQANDPSAEPTLSNGGAGEFRDDVEEDAFEDRERRGGPEDLLRR